MAFDESGRLYLGGFFTYAGGLKAQGLARWSQAGWEALGDGAVDVWALALRNDTIYVGGDVTDPHAHALEVRRLSDGDWESLGRFRHGCCSGPTIYAMATDSRGLLYVAGDFETVDGEPRNSIAMWDGTSWHELGEGLDGHGLFDTVVDQVFAMAALDSIVYVGGRFTRAGGQEARRIARWNGHEWEPLGGGFGPEVDLNVSTSVSAIIVAKDGSVYAGGAFTNSGEETLSNIARWDGAAWLPLGMGVNGYVDAIHELNGDIYVAGQFTEAGGRPAANIARWDGENWHPLGLGLKGSVSALESDPAGRLYAAGWFSRAGNAPVENIARWNGSSWEAIWTGQNGGMNRDVHTLRSTRNGLYAGGSFGRAGSVAAGGLALWNGAEWESVGNGTNGDVLTLSVRGDSVVVGGTFTGAGDIEASNVALWNGHEWFGLSDGVNDRVNSVEFAPNGDIYAGGTFSEAGGKSIAHVARWDGSTWHALGGGLDGPVRRLAIDASGLVYAGGWFVNADGRPASRIAVWDGSAWNQLGEGVSEGVVRAILIDESLLYVGGFFRMAGGAPAKNLARWDGAGWENLGTDEIGEIYDLAMSPAGDLFAGGFFYGLSDGPGQYVAKKEGDSWVPLNEGVDSYVRSLAFHEGDLFVGGGFRWADGISSNYIGRWSENSDVSTDPFAESVDELSISVFPNPSSGKATAQLDLTDSRHVRIDLFDSLGRAVKIIIDAHVHAGTSYIDLDLESLVNGVYHYRIQAGTQQTMGVLLLAR